MERSRTVRRGWVLAAACLAAFAINLDTTIVNVALPSLTRELHASTRDLQWVVDGYNLAFAALVLAAGALGDRYGRRPALITGLLGFAAASGVGALCGDPGQLIAARVVMGGFAALIYPTTLSVITNAFPDRRERAKAIGVWGGVTGIGVAVGPVTGGLLLAHLSWPAVFVALVPVALIAALAAAVAVPESRDPAAPAVDRAGLALSTSFIALLVYTVIEAPGHGWLAPSTLLGWAGSVALLVGFVSVERRATEPMLDVRLFRDPRFSAASASVTVAFFALFGFIFLITQYFQAVRGYGVLRAGVATLPVAGSIAVSSIIGAQLATRLGTRAVVTTGLLLFGTAFAWIAAASGISTPYAEVALQMVVMGTGLGLTSTPATESILTVLPAAKAGVGSAVNDATRELGGTLGVAVVGSIYSSLYLSRLGGGAVAQLPAPVAALARSSVGAGGAVAASVPGAQGPAVLQQVHAAFLTGLHVGCLVAAGVCWAGAALAGRALPGRTATRAAVAADRARDPVLAAA